MKFLIPLLLLSFSLLAETIITPSGTYLINKSGSSTYIQQIGKTKGYTGPEIVPAVPITPGSTLYTTSGSYLITDDMILQIGKTKKD
jgi:hypothetical protein